MKTVASIVFGSATLDPTAPSLFSRTSPAQFSRDEVRLTPPRNVSIDVENAKKIIDSGRSLFLEAHNKSY